MKDIYFEYDPKETTVFQAITYAYQNAGRWYKITDIEIKQKADDKTRFYCKANIIKK